MNDGTRIGVVLSSGGIRGVYAHTGFLLALEQLGLPISALVGCSAGAVVGGIAASGADLHAWSRALARVKRAEFWTPDPPWRFFWRIAARRGRGYTGFSGTEAAGSFCRRHLAAERIEDCRYPFHTLAVNLGSGAKTMFSSGEMLPRILASAAMPVLYRPVNIEGELYCDGALLDLAPMDAICCRHRLDVLIVHHVAARHAGTPELLHRLQEPWSLLTILERLLYRQRPWYLSQAPLGFHRCPCGCGAAVVVLEPRLPELRWPLTEGGPQIETAANTQALALLRPYLEALSSNPRTRLPLQIAEDRSEKTGCERT